jgi:tRNA U38,U39,U40 pseudouridine synthase TruA
VIEEALAKVFAQPVRIHGAATDAGVHAARSAHFRRTVRDSSARAVLGINQLLPADIRITRAGESRRTSMRGSRRRRT